MTTLETLKCDQRAALADLQVATDEIAKLQTTAKVFSTRDVAQALSNQISKVHGDKAEKIFKDLLGVLLSCIVLGFNETDPNDTTLIEGLYADLQTETGINYDDEE